MGQICTDLRGHSASWSQPKHYHYVYPSVQMSDRLFASRKDNQKLLNVIGHYGTNLITQSNFLYLVLRIRSDGVAEGRRKFHGCVG